MSDVRIVSVRTATEEEIAEALGISSDTVLRDWKSAKLWLYRDLRSGQER